MAYDEKLAARVRKAVAGRRNIAESELFGGLGFMLRGNVMCGVLGDVLVVRLGRDGTAEALERPHTRPFDFTGRVMRTMVFVDPAGLRGKALAGWIERGYQFARTLPAK